MRRCWDTRFNIGKTERMLVDNLAVFGDGEGERRGATFFHGLGSVGFDFAEVVLIRSHGGLRCQKHGENYCSSYLHFQDFLVGDKVLGNRRLPLVRFRSTETRTKLHGRNAETPFERPTEYVGAAKAHSFGNLFDAGVARQQSMPRFFGA